ncbi:MAG: hypothetical protein D6705_13950 [Deltaproteobacteria bacterium]|nr:MAG: hypothetical protein D6705_13950 [Deltaproteobacteria bacterium]
MRLAGCFILLLGLAACADRTVPLDPTTDTEGENVERPEVGMWAPCASQAECMDAPICVYPADESGFCTQSCETVADCPEAYAPPSNPTCVDLGDELPMCALDCSGGAGCPPQMRCTAVATPGGERKLCF